MQKKTFANNLTVAIRQSEFSPRQLALKVEMRPETLWRWMNNGVERVNGKSREKLVELCELLDLDASSLWLVSKSRAGECAEKIRHLVTIWEEIGISFDWIDLWYVATKVINRLRLEEPEIWQRQMRVKVMESDAHLAIEFEVWLRGKIGKIGLDEEQAYKVLYKKATAHSE